MIDKNKDKRKNLLIDVGDNYDNKQQMMHMSNYTNFAIVTKWIRIYK